VQPHAPHRMHSTCNLLQCTDMCAAATDGLWVQGGYPTPHLLLRVPQANSSLDWTFQWFFTALLLRPLTSRAMSVHLLPRADCACGWVACGRAAHAWWSGRRLIRTCLPYSMGGRIRRTCNAASTPMNCVCVVVGQLLGRTRNMTAVSHSEKGASVGWVTVGSR
jgi:hypothetical protein